MRQCAEVWAAARLGHGNLFSARLDAEAAHRALLNKMAKAEEAERSRARTLRKLERTQPPAVIQKQDQ